MRSVVLGLLFLACGCATAPRSSREPFALTPGWPVVPGAKAERRLAVEDPQAAAKLRAALGVFGETLRPLRAKAAAGAPMPVEATSAWGAVLHAVERELATPLTHASAFDSARARIILETELDSDRGTFGDLPPELAERIKKDLRGLGGRVTALTKPPPRVNLAAFAWPVTPVVVTSPYGTRDHPIRRVAQFHMGIDLMADEAQPIYAAESGTVVFSGWNGGYGQEIELQHDGRTFTRYGHLLSLLVRDGAPVSRGQLIGTAGQTGFATGPHLHFEVRRDDLPLDPEVVMRPWDPQRPVGGAVSARGPAR